MTASEIKSLLATLEDPQKAEHAQRFFKTGPGEYGEGDVFRGIRVPALRQIARQYRKLPLSEARLLLPTRLSMRTDSLRSASWYICIMQGRTMTFIAHT